MSHDNVDAETVAGFGDEWQRFDFQDRPSTILDASFEEYFSIFPWSELPADATGFDAGCGSGRWAARVAPRVGHLHCIDASGDALDVARANLSGSKNCSFHEASVNEIPLGDASMDFGFSLGVLHHTPDPRAALAACVRKLKPGAPFLVYLYYSLDNRPRAYRALWRTSDWVRRGVSRLPHESRYWVSQAMAALVYWPLARGARLAERVGLDPQGLPLAYYRDKDFYLMRNDALDRFGTKVEHRFSRKEIEIMMLEVGLERVGFREGAPYWCALGYAPQRAHSSSSR